MDIKYTEKAKKVLEKAKKIAKEFESRFVGTEHLLIAIISEECSTKTVFIENGVDENKIRTLIRRLVVEDKKVTESKNDIEFSERVGLILKKAESEALKYKFSKVGTEHIAISILIENENLATGLLKTLGINIQKLYLDIVASMGEEAIEIVKEEGVADISNEPKESLTPTLDKYSNDITRLSKEKKIDPIIGREEELNRIIQILSRRTKNNPVLVGDPGVGKTAIIEGLAHKIINNDIPDSLKDKRLLSVDLSAMVAGSKYRGEFEERIKKLMNEVIKDKNVILFIDEIHTIIGAGGTEGSIDASNILKPALSRSLIQIIGATTKEEYRKYFEKDAALERRFQPINVEEPSIEESIEILKGIRGEYEKHHDIKITDEAIEQAVNLSSRYISDRFLPDKAIDLIDEAASKIKLNFTYKKDEIKTISNELEKINKEKEEAIKENRLIKLSNILKKYKEKKEELEIVKNKNSFNKNNKKELKKEDVFQVISEWTKIPLSKLEKEESKKLLNLEKTLHKSVIGQEEAILALSKSIRRARVGLKDPKKPIGSFLFLGPTGVGKTQISKSLADELFGSEKALIRVDMSEYMEKHSVSKLIGSPPGYVGYEEGGQLSEKIRRNPYSIILFDEIEKAHPDIFNILLQVLDDGHITDSSGRKIDFKNTIIIMTSNVGAMNIVEPKNLGFISVKNEEKDYIEMKNRVLEEVKKMFKPEFINRIDEMIVFHQLNKEHIKKILEIMIEDINKRIYQQMKITLKIKNEARDFVVEKSFDPKYGARPLKRSLQNLLEDKLAEEILIKKIKKGQNIIITLNEKTNSLEFNVDKKEKNVKK